MFNGKPYFPATECARVLGYNQPEHAVKRHCKSDGCMKRTVIDNLGREQKKKYINEGNLYRLIIRSKLPAAESFERWVFDEVLVSIRKHGAYILDEVLEAVEQSHEVALELFTKLKSEREMNKALVDKVEMLSTKAVYFDTIMQSTNIIPISVIAKEYGMTATDFNSLLHDIRIQYKLGGTWILYQPYADKGYTKTRTYFVNETESSIHTYWTQSGRMFIYETLKKYGIMPLGESDYPIM